MSDREGNGKERAPWPIESPEDVYDLRDWVESHAPEWMEGLHFDTMAALDHYGAPPPEDWTGASIHHSADPDDPWIVQIETEDGPVEIDLGDNWDAAWHFYDWMESEYDIEVERDVEYGKTD